LRSFITFRDWLRNEQRSERISQIELDLTLELVSGGFNHSATQILAHLEGFISIYHRLPITTTIYRFAQIDGMARYWDQTDQSINIERESIRRLTEYFQGLDEEHKIDLTAHARNIHSNTSVDSQIRVFWGQVIDALNI
jgi:hypothetical protein